MEGNYNNAMLRIFSLRYYTLERDGRELQREIAQAVGVSDYTLERDGRELQLNESTS